jgi:hypothetical protein
VNLLRHYHPDYVGQTVTRLDFEFVEYNLDICIGTFEWPLQIASGMKCPYPMWWWVYLFPFSQSLWLIPQRNCCNALLDWQSEQFKLLHRPSQMSLRLDICGRWSGRGLWTWVCFDLTPLFATSLRRATPAIVWCCLPWFGASAKIAVSMLGSPRRDRTNQDLLQPTRWVSPCGCCLSRRNADC